MADAPPRQGWRVPQRGPLLAALLTVLFVAALLGIAGRAYLRLVAPDRVPKHETFPAPGIETYVHDGQGDPVRPRPRRTPDPAIEAAKDAIVTHGIAGWP